MDILLLRQVRTTVYAGKYEKITENGKTREFYYLDGNTIAVKENDSIKIYLAFTDNIGSILSVMDEEGNKVFEASYDAWGKQTVSLNTIGLRRGYTGHEMLTKFDIICTYTVFVWQLWYRPCVWTCNG